MPARRDPQVEGAMWLAPAGDDVAGELVSWVLAALPVPQIGTEVFAVLASLRGGGRSIDEVAAFHRISPRDVRALCLHYGIRFAVVDAAERRERDRLRAALRPAPRPRPYVPPAPAHSFIAHTLPPGDRD